MYSILFAVTIAHTCRSNRVLDCSPPPHRTSRARCWRCGSRQKAVVRPSVCSVGSSLPSVPCRLTSLDELDCSFNEIEALPATVGNCVHIRTFAADHNFLTQLPSEVSGGAQGVAPGATQRGGVETWVLTLGGGEEGGEGGEEIQGC